MYRPLSLEMTKHWQLLLGQLIFNNSLPKDWHHTHWLLLSFYLCVVSWGFALVETWYSDWTWEPTRLIRYCYSSFSFLIWLSCSGFHRPNKPHTLLIMSILKISTIHVLYFTLNFHRIFQTHTMHTLYKHVTLHTPHWSRYITTTHWDFNQSKPTYTLLWMKFQWRHHFHFFDIYL